MNLYTENPVKWFLIPDYTENESIIMYYGNHGFIDGVQFFSILQAMTVEKNFALLPKVAPPDLKTKIMGEIIKPYAMVRTLFGLLKLPNQNNCITGTERASDPRYRKALVSDRYNAKAIMK
jgi:hypothetical protein